MGNINSKTDNRWEICKDEELGNKKYLKGIEKRTGKKVTIQKFPKKKLDIKITKDHETQTIEKKFKMLITSSKLKNPFLIKYLGHFELKDNKYLVSESIKSGNLRELLNTRVQISEKEALKISHQILIGLKALFTMNLKSIELKPENIFLSEEKNIKIGDFGNFSKLSNSLILPNQKPYTAPEMHFSKENLTQAVDIWAFGCIVHEMIFGKPPLIQRKEITKTNLIDFEYKVPNDPPIQEETKKMLRNCLKQLPRDRIQIDELLAHKCFDSCREHTLGLLGSGIETMTGKFKKVERIMNKRGSILSLNLNLKHVLRSYKIIKEEKKKTDFSNNFQEIENHLNYYQDFSSFLLETSKSLEEKKNIFKQISKKTFLNENFDLILLKKAFNRSLAIRELLKTTSIENISQRNKLKSLLEKIGITANNEFSPLSITPKIWLDFINSLEGSICKKYLLEKILELEEFFDEMIQKDIKTESRLIELEGKDCFEKKKFQKLVCEKVLEFKVFYEKCEKGLRDREILKIASRLVVVYGIETYSVCFPFSDNLEKFVEQMKKRSDEDLLKFLRNFFLNLEKSVNDVIQGR